MIPIVMLVFVIAFMILFILFTFLQKPSNHRNEEIH